MKHILGTVVCILGVIFIDDCVHHVYPTTPVTIANTTVGRVMPQGKHRELYMKLYKYHGYPLFVDPDGYFYRKNKRGKVEKCKFYINIPDKR
jgi:hypothetical protein